MAAVAALPPLPSSRVRYSPAAAAPVPHGWRPPPPAPRQWQCAVFGGSGGGGGDGDKKKFIKREEEPEEYWQSAAEKEGKGAMSTPLPYIAILSLLTPFTILAFGFANGWIKLPAR